MSKASSSSNPVLALAEQLRDLSVPELIVRYESEWSRPPRLHHAAWLRKQIARRVHERECGGLSKLALARLETLMSEITVFDEPSPPRTRTSRAAGSGSSTRTTNALPIGTVLERTWRGREVCAEITADGVLVDGVTHGSLSAAANAITGTHTSGNRFFGITKPRQVR